MRTECAGSRSRQKVSTVLRIVLVQLALLLAAPAFAQPARVEPGRIETRLERGYARLILTFADRPRHQVSAQSGVFVLRFDRSIDVDVGAIAATIPGYVAGVRRDGDGSALRFALSRRVRVNTTEAGDQLYVDLLPEPWSGAVPALPPQVTAELQRRAEELERERQEEEARQRRRAMVGPVRVTTAETPTFSRLEFRWREAVSPTIQRSEREIRITFDRLGTIEVGAVRARGLRFLEAIGVAEDNARSVVTLTVDPARDVRTFVEGSSFFVDLKGVEGAAPGASADGEEGSGERVTQQGTTLAGEADRAPPAQVGAPTARAPDASRPRAAAAEERTSQPQASRTLGSSVHGNVRVFAGFVGGVGQLRFQFPGETPMAAFIRGSTLWLAFETPETFDVRLFQTELAQLIRAAQRDRAGAIEIVRLQLAQPAVVAAVANGSEWTVLIGDVPEDGAKAIDVVTRQHADGRAYLLAELPRPSRIHRVRDPSVGDHLTIVTAFGPNAQLSKPQRFVEFEMLKTAQGLVLRDVGDDIAVRIAPEGIAIDREAGLSLTTGGAVRASLLSPNAAPEQRIGFVDFEGWKLGPVDRFVQLRGELVRRSAGLEGAPRTAARLDLARFYVAHGLGTEAYSLFHLIANDDPTVERDRSFRVLRGASAILAGRGREGQRDLDDPTLDDSADVALWRSLVAAEQGNWQKARHEAQRGQNVLAQYPRVFQARILRVLVEALLELKDVAGVPALLDELQALDTSVTGRAKLSLLRGRHAESVGRHEAALDAYAEAASNDRGATAAEATLARVLLASRIDRMPRDTAVAELSSLSMSWRGGDIEVEAYRQFARLQVQQGRHREAFAALKSVSIAAPRSDSVRALQDEMRDAFADLFLEGGADRKSPLEYLTLFYDFRELTPSGSRGDELVRNLADRLVEVDLLDQAIILLAHQVDNRLQGAARAEVAAQLAFVHLLNREPDKVLAVLRRTRLATLPDDIERRRNLIEARALAALGRASLAVELIGSDSNDETRRLRADLLFEGRRYDEAAAALEEALGDVWRRTGQLPDRLRADVLRIAVGFALAGDQRALDRIRTRYSARMVDTPEATAFAVLTARIESQGTEFRALARSIAAADSMQRFLSEYRERYFPARQRTQPAAPQASEASAATRNG